MVRAARSATAAALTALLVCLPVVVDQCAASCDAHQTSAASTPPCHHARGAGAHLGGAPAACSHDHSASLGAVQAMRPVSLRALAGVVALAAAVHPVYQPSPGLAATHAPPGSPGPLHAASLPLRV